MRWYKADLHIHSVLSPCGGLEMSPKNIFDAAKKRGINLIAITDHNSMKNCVAYQKVAQQYGIFFLYGVEIQTVEEIHIIALFDNKENALYFDKLLYNSLIPIKNSPDYFGDQVIIDENENIIGFEEIALINSTIWDYDTTIKHVVDCGGFCFPAHIDASAFSVIGQLGFLPKNKNIIALGITKRCNIQTLLKNYPYLKNYSFIKNSDAHYVKDVGTGYTNFFMEKPILSEIKQALKKINNRKIKIGG